MAEHGMKCLCDPINNLVIGTVPCSQNHFYSALGTKFIQPLLIEKLPIIFVRQDSPHYEILWCEASKANTQIVYIRFA